MTSPELEALVDLGNVTDRPDVPDAGPGWATLRSIRIAVPILAVLLLLAGAGPVPRPQLTKVADLSVGVDADVLLSGGRMFVGSYGLTNTIAAYALDNGERLWSVDDADAPGALLSADGTIVVSSNGITSQDTETEAYDQATGHRLWTSTYGSAAVTARGLLVASAPSATTFGDGFTDPAGYGLLDPRTGSVLWSVNVPDGCVTAYAGSGLPTVLVEVCDADSSVRTIDLADGHMIAERFVPLGQGTNIAQLDPAEVMERPQVTVIGDTLLIAHANVPTPTVDAYALDTLSPRWNGLAEQQAQYIAACGDAICFYSTSETGIRIDVTTGHSLGPIPVSAPGSAGPEALQLATSNGKPPTVMPTVPVGSVIPIQPDDNGPVWLERASGELIAPLPGAGPTSCAQSAGYIVCTTVDNRVRVWHLP